MQCEKYSRLESAGRAVINIIVSVMLSGGGRVFVERCFVLEKTSKEYIGHIHITMASLTNTLISSLMKKVKLLNKETFIGNFKPTQLLQSQLQMSG